MRKIQEPNYKLVIKTDSYTGNFERECIAYVLGILDEIQREINYAPEYLDSFHKEENLSFQDCANFLEEYLFERWQEVDDWEQMTFYEIGGEKCQDIFIFIDKLFPKEWEERIIKRIINFFNGGYKEVAIKAKEDEYIKKYPQLLEIKLIINNNVIKQYYIKD